METSIFGYFVNFFFSPSIIKKQTVWLWQKFIPGYVYNLENEVE